MGINNSKHHEIRIKILNNQFHWKVSGHPPKLNISHVTVQKIHQTNRIVGNEKKSPNCRQACESLI